MGRKIRLFLRPSVQSVQSVAKSPPFAVSEVETQLSLERAMIGALGCDTAKRRGAVDAVSGRTKIGMVQNIGCIHSELDSLCFREFDVLTHRPVKSPNSRQLHRLLAESSSMSGLRILKQNLVRLGVCDRL